VRVAIWIAIAVAVSHGVLAIALRIYAWRTWKGWAAFMLDHTWGLVGTALALLLHLVNLVWPGGPRYVDGLSRGQNRFVYDGGFGFGRFAFTQGTVVSNLNRSRGDLVDHENLHVWQSRLFGPLFQTTYVAWFLLGALAGTLMAPFAKQSWYQTVTDVAYLDNPWETWAYKRGGHAAGGRFSWI
jgi:hypothetical protein